MRTILFEFYLIKAKSLIIDMENFTFRISANVKFLTKLEREKKQIFEAVQNVYGGSTPSLVTMMKCWIRRFKQGSESLEDNLPSDLPVTSVTDEKIDAIQAVVEETDDR